MAGRRPKPVEVREGMGNPGKREMPTPPPRVEGLVSPPADMKGPALACWKAMADLLTKRGQLTLDSRPSLVCLCETYAERERHKKTLANKGWVMKQVATNGHTVEKPRPEVAMYQDADRRYRAWLIEFGLTDASRGKVNALSIRPPAHEGQGKPAEEAEAPGSRYGLN